MGDPECPRPLEGDMSVAPLVSVDKTGKPYRRRADVEVVISQMLARPVDEWAVAAQRTGSGRLPTEALVFLIRTLRGSDKNLVGALVNILCRRLLPVARSFAGGFETVVTDEILREVQDQIIELLFQKIPTRQTEFLEIAFREAVKRRTLNVVEKVKKRPKLVVVADRRDEEDDDPEHLVESLPEKRPNVQEVLVRLADEAQRSILIRTALAAVKDRRHVEAVILRYVYGWPISHSDPAQPSLEKHFAKSGRQIQNWIAGALKAMRNAIGDSQ
jgi:hypothetical protein